MEKGNVIIDAEPKQQHDPERYVFAKWFRRAMKVRKIRFKEARIWMDVPTQEFNNWIEDEPGMGKPVVPSDDDCHMIAELLGISPDIVIGVAETARAAADRMIAIEEPEPEEPDGNRLD